MDQILFVGIVLGLLDWMMAGYVIGCVISTWRISGGDMKKVVVDWMLLALLVVLYIFLIPSVSDIYK